MSHWSGDGSLDYQHPSFGKYQMSFVKYQVSNKYPEAIQEILLFHV